jgi:hypothetical protein
MSNGLARAVHECRNFRLGEFPVGRTGEQRFLVTRLQPTQGDVQWVDVAAMSIQEHYAGVAIVQ